MARLIVKNRTSSCRDAFTLLEVMLATSIAVFIMYGLYVAIDLNLGSADSGRTVVERSSLARSLFALISNDLKPSIGLPDPGRFRPSNGSGEDTSGTTTDSTTTDEGTGDEGTGSLEEAILGTTGGRPLAVVGDEYSLTVFVSRVPREEYINANSEDDEIDLENPAEGIVSDQRQITYWLVGDEGSAQGLARQEIKLVTEQSDESEDFDTTDESNFIIADEVRDLTFAYWDGKAWLSNWDGTVPPANSQSQTPQGPPLAIEITLEIETVGSGVNPVPRRQKYRHVIHIPTANGINQVVEGSGSTTP